MAATNGPGNGDWTRDETILALDLYLAAGRVPNSNDPRILELSDYLRALPLHPPEKRNASFRNPDGVAFKIGNLRSVETGKGLKNVSKVDRLVWAELGSNPNDVSAMATAIRDAGKALQALPDTADVQPEVEDEYFPEGGASAVLHRRLERNRRLRVQLLKRRKKSGSLTCDACGYFPPLDDALADAAFEAHHIHPLGSIGKSITTLADVALLCATCHRLIHRAMVVQKRWVSLSSFRTLFFPITRSEQGDR